MPEIESTSSSVILTGCGGTGSSLECAGEKFTMKVAIDAKAAEGTDVVRNTQTVKV